MSAAAVRYRLEQVRLPVGATMNAGQRKTLRVMLSTASEDGWCAKTFEYLGYLSKQHRTTVGRHVAQFLAWGIVEPESRFIGGDQTIVRDGWRLRLAGVNPKPREKKVDLDEFRRLQRLLEAHRRELEAEQEKNRKLVQQLAQKDQTLQRLINTGGGADRQVITHDTTVQAFAAKLNTTQVSYAELKTRRRDGQPERVYGAPAELAPLVERGLATGIASEPLWPDWRDAPPRPSLAMLAHLASSDDPADLHDILYWYRAHLFEHPDQLQFWGRLHALKVRDEARNRAHISRHSHARRLQALLETHVAKESREASVLLTGPPDRGMSEEDDDDPRATLLAMFAPKRIVPSMCDSEAGKELGDDEPT